MSSVGSATSKNVKLSFIWGEKEVSIIFFIETQKQLMNWKFEKLED